MRWVRPTAVLSLPLLLAMCGGPRQSAAVPLRILAFNDFHGYLEPPTGSNARVGSAAAAAGGVEYLATHLKRLAAGHPNTIIVTAGDNIGASPLFSNYFHDEPTINALNAAGVQLSSVGNHEFDKGPAELLRMQRGGCHPTDGCQDGAAFSGATFQYLAANVLTGAPGDSPRATLFPAYAIREFGGVKVGFIGLTLQDTPAIVLPAGTAGLTFAAEAATTNALVPELERQGVHAIVVLLHQGGTPADQDHYDGCDGVNGPIVEIAKEMSPDVSVILSGHVHEAYTCTMSGKLVTNAMSFGRLITAIDLTIDRATGRVISTSAHNTIVTRDVPKDPAETAILERYRPLYTAFGAKPAGVISGDLSREINAAGESPLGDVIADAELDFARRHGAGDVAAAMMNKGGVRADLLPGPSGAVTYAQLFDVQPFGNRLVVMTLTGDMIERLLESQFRNNKVTNLLQISDGFSYAYDLSRPQGQRVDRRSIRIARRPLDPGRSYRLVLNEFIARGGDGFDVFKEGAGWMDVGLDLDALLQYFQAHRPVEPVPLNRIRSETGTSASQ